MIEWIEIKKLTPNPKNPNKHSEDQIKRLAEIITYQGWRHPIIVDKNYMIWAGHGRLLAAKELKLEKVPVHIQEFQTEEQAYAFLVSDNAIASWAELDLSAINLEVPELGPDFDIDLLGIKDFTLDVSDKDSGCEEDEVPEVKIECFVQLGDLYELGSHRLLCGDSAVKENVDRLMNGEKADMVFTDPPYGINLDTDYHGLMESNVGKKFPRRESFGTRKNYAPIINDHFEFDPSYLLEAFKACEDIFIFGANNFIHLIAGYQSGSWVCWDKKTETLDRMITSDFELCWSKKRHKYAMCRIVWSGIFGSDEGLAGHRKVHPTQKPVKLAEWFFERWGKEAKIIWDGYLGSGSTLIACQKTNRRCFGMEIDPHYCQVILERWAKYTGKDPVREDGKLWSEVKLGG